MCVDWQMHSVNYYHYYSDNRHALHSFFVAGTLGRPATSFSLKVVPMPVAFMRRRSFAQQCSTSIELNAAVF